MKRTGSDSVDVHTVTQRWKHVRAGHVARLPTNQLHSTGLALFHPRTFNIRFKGFGCLVTAGATAAQSPQAPGIKG